MMKTIAILLFSALALTGCATDEPTDDVTTVDKAKDGESLLDPAIAQWAKDYTAAPRAIGPQQALEEWAEDIIIQDHLYTLFHGNFGVLLTNALGERIIEIPSHDRAPGF